jgi:microcystin-dependent protein
MIDIPITSATVPSPLDCVVSNANWQALVALLQATFPEDASIFNICNSEPSPARRVYPWFRCNADGTPDKWYKYSMGSWISLHPMAPGAVIMYEGSEASIDTFDGGEAGAVTAISGPMWQKVTQMNARFPVGPGTLPSTAVINVGDTGGEEDHELIEEEIPEHTHLIADPEVNATSLTSPNQVLDNQVTDAGLLNYTLQGKTDEEATVGKTSPFGGDASGNTVAHNNLPPYLGIWFIRRTARTHYRL